MSDIFDNADIEGLIYNISKDILFTRNTLFLEQILYDFETTTSVPISTNMLEFVNCCLSDIDFEKFKKYDVKYFIIQHKREHDLYVVFNNQHEFVHYKLKE